MKWPWRRRAKIVIQREKDGTWPKWAVVTLMEAHYQKGGHREHLDALEKVAKLHR